MRLRTTIEVLTNMANNSGTSLAAPKEVKKQTVPTVKDTSWFEYDLDKIGFDDPLLKTPEKSQGDFSAFGSMDISGISEKPKVSTDQLDKIFGNVATVAEHTGKIISKAAPEVKEGAAAIFELASMIAGTANVAETKKPDQKDEIEKQQKINAIRERLNQIGMGINQEARNREAKVAMGMIGSLEPTEEDKKVLHLNQNYVDTKGVYHYNALVEARAAIKAQQEKVETKQKDASIQPKKMAVDLEAQGEGGTGRGFANISSTGGGGVG